MRKFWVIAIVFAAGSNFDHLLNGGTDTLFGTHWLLAVYVVAGLIVGWTEMPRPAVALTESKSP